MERVEYDLHLAEQVKSIVPDLKYILCLGWMHILSAEFINQFPPKTIVNLHPALPGKFPGKDAVAEAFKYIFSQPGAFTAPLNYYRNIIQIYSYI